MKIAQVEGRAVRVAADLAQLHCLRKATFDKDRITLVFLDWTLVADIEASSGAAHVAYTWGRNGRCPEGSAISSLASEDSACIAADVRMRISEIRTWTVGALIPGGIGRKGDSC